ncbi:MAG: hypothetical protein JZU47_08115 [Prolixibacteraceae bacterium]|nr:hypothetical protein [Prolixibacteraceae bacterium]
MILDNRDNKESTYKILSKILKIKFYSELKESGIELGKIYWSKNLQSGIITYLVEINDKEFQFSKPIDFVVLFSRYLESTIKYYNERYEYLINIPSSEFNDELSIERQYKEIDYYRYQQTKILKIMNEYKAKIIKDIQN